MTVSARVVGSRGPGPLGPAPHPLEDVCPCAYLNTHSMPTVLRVRGVRGYGQDVA